MITDSTISPALLAATVLFVEDDQAILDGVTDLFTYSAKRFDLTVLTASNGSEALEVLESHTPDLIVSDVSMPLMGGYELLAHVRDSSDTAHIPFILLTAKASSRDISQGLSKGVELYVTKPFDSFQLVELVETQLEKSLQQRSVRESRESQMRRDLSRTLQHELRTPLALVTAYLEFIDMSIGDAVPTDDAAAQAEEIQEYLRGIDVGIQRLTRLIGDVVASLDLRTGRVLATVRAEADYFGGIEGLLRESLATARLRHEHDHVKVAFDIDPELKLLYGQRAYLKDVFVRLICNAFKFTQYKNAGNLTIRARALDANSAENIPSLGTGANYVTIDFIDDGIGFPNHARHRLTDLFYQHDREHWEQQGPGVGLNVVNGIVNAHNGRLKLRGVPNEGSTISVILPHFDSASDTPPELGTVSQRQHMITVLLVEDDEMVRDVFIDLAEVFESDFRYEILIADDGLQALEQLETVVPDIIVSDIRMPKMDGLEMLTLIRQKPTLSEVPIIFLSGNRRPEQVHAGRKLGVDEYIAKPYEPQHLFARINTLVKRHFEKQAAEADNFNVLKENVLASVELSIIEPLKAMAKHSNTMRSLVQNEETLAASTDVDGLRQSLVGIQNNSSQISDMVRNATVLVEIRTGAADAAFKFRAGMVDSLGDLLAETARDVGASAEFASASCLCSQIIVEHDAANLPIYGNPKMLSTAFTHLLQFLSRQFVRREPLTVRLSEVDGNPTVSAEMAINALAPAALERLQKLDETTVDASEASLVIFREYMRLHDAEPITQCENGHLTVSITFPPLDIEALLNP